MSLEPIDINNKNDRISFIIYVTFTRYQTLAPKIYLLFNIVKIFFQRNCIVEFFIFCPI